MVFYRVPILLGSIFYLSLLKKGCNHVAGVPGSLCTMLSLQWEPEIIAVAVMYLAGRLCKFDIQEWTTKQSSRRWWEQFVQDVPVELLEGTPLEATSFPAFFSDVFFYFLFF